MPKQPLRRLTNTDSLRRLDLGVHPRIASRRPLGSGAGGLLALAIVGVWMAWQADRVHVIEPDAPLPRALPASSLMGSIATLPPSAGPGVRIAAPTPASPVDKASAQETSDGSGLEPEVPGGG